MNEFEIISRFLSIETANRKDVLKGVGDDCALLKVPRGQRLAVSMDTLIAGTHFMADANGADVAHKAVAVNLSDLAAAGAEPAWVTMALTLPESNLEWLEDFSRGLKNILSYFGVSLVGGDTTRGPLAITIQAHGFVPEQVFHQRSNAKAGDLVCLTGPVGDGALGLLVAKKELELPDEASAALLKKYQTPNPKIAAGIALRGRATSAIDISDGLLADLNHISKASNVGAILQWDKIPLSNAVKSVKDESLVMRSALTGGDDYELCFTVQEDELDAATNALEMVGNDCIVIGRLTGKTGVRVMQGKHEVELSDLGYQHF